MIYLYAITGPLDPAELDGCEGLGSTEVSALEVGELTAVFSPVPVAAVKLDESSILQHERVLDRLMERRTVLPVRFGTTFSDHGSLTAELERRSATLREDLSRLDGKVELGIRILRPPPAAGAGGDAAPAPSTGRDYILGKVKEHQGRALQAESARRELEPLHERLRDLAVDARTRWSVDPATPLVASYLVAKSDIELFRDQSSRLEGEFPGVQVFLTGPWPPYNFVGGTDDESVHP